MSPAMKLIIGLLGVGLLTWLFLGPFGHARTIADDLENRALAALEAEGAEGVSVSVSRRPVGRTIYLDGDFPDDVKRRMSEIALAQHGVSNVVWDSGEPEPATGEGATATSAAVASCQDEISGIVAEESIQFQMGSTYVSPASGRLLDRIAEAAGDCDGMAIEIAGHTDSSGPDDVNRRLSAGRAEEVRNALVERGLPAGMLTAVGKGEDEPLGDNPADPANRRIEFTVSAAGQGGES